MLTTQKVACMYAQKQFGTNKKVDRAATQIDLQKLYVSILAHITNFVHRSVKNDDY